MKPSLNQVTCPHCNESFDVEEAIAHQAAERIQAQYAQREREAKAKIAAKEKELATKEADLAKAQTEIDLQVQRQLGLEKEAMMKKLKLQVETEQAAMLKSLQEELQAKSQEASTLKAKELELMKEKRKLEEKQRDFDTEVGKKVLERQSEIEQRVREEEKEAAYLLLKQEEKKNADLRDKIKELERKADQGSMQSQGDIQEVELEHILSESFRLDRFTVVKKGQSGADLIQGVRARNGKDVGAIAWESKRTKAFSDQWIGKLKQDMIRHNAEVGVIVTETMPADMPSFGFRQGVWVCKFSEAAALAAVLRHGLLRVGEVQTAEINKGDKMHMLYDFLMSTEFRQQMDAIINGFTAQKELLDKEKRTIMKLWKYREKSIEGIIQNALNMDGSIKGIARSIDEEDELEKLEAEYPDISLS